MAKTVNDDLFAAADRALARRQDPQTSHAAAGSLDEALPALEALVLAAIKTHRAGGLTSNELADVTGLSLVTVSPRLRPLANKGLIRDSSVRRVGASGRRSIVWLPTAA